jgi:AcrR family transcriptional regulator
MNASRGDSEQTKAAIIAAARGLFAAKGILAVSVRDVAGAAGVTHGLVHHYFGTKEQLITEVIRNEVTSNAGVLLSNPISASPDSLDVMRRVLRHFLTEARESALLIARAELTGLEPEKMRPEGTVGTLEMMSRRFAELQADTGTQGLRVDPALASVFVGAAVMGLVTMHPWLMASAGLKPEDYETRLDEIVETMLAFIGMAIGLPQGKE